MKSSQSSAKSTIKETFKKFFSFEESSLFLALIALVVVLSFLSPVFLSTYNIMNVLRQISLTAIAGLGTCIIILSGEIDLSVGSVQGFVGVFSVMALNYFESVFIALLVALLIGAIIGLVNGLLVTKAHVNSLIATLGTMAIIRGAVLVITGASSITARVGEFIEVGTGFIGPFPIPVVITFFLAIIFYFIMNNTSFGRYVYAIGDNEEAANLSGISVDKIKILVFVIGGVLAALSAFILASRMNSGQPNAGTGFELLVIAAVILGGVSLKGGQGSILGAIIGVMILGVLSNGLTLMGVSSFYHEIVRGSVIIIAVFMDERRKRKQAEVVLRN